MRAVSAYRHRRSSWRSPGSRARSVRACQGLRPRRVARTLAMAHADVWPSATQTASAPGTRFLSRLDGWPARTPADASPAPSRMPAHGLGPMWFAIPSSRGTCTPYSLPVSRRTRVKTPRGVRRWAGLDGRAGRSAVRVSLGARARRWGRLEGRCGSLKAAVRGPTSPAPSTFLRYPGSASLASGCRRVHASSSRCARAGAFE